VAFLVHFEDVFFYVSQDGVLSSHDEIVDYCEDILSHVDVFPIGEGLKEGCSFLFSFQIFLDADLAHFQILHDQLSIHLVKQIHHQITKFLENMDLPMEHNLQLAFGLGAFGHFFNFTLLKNWNSR
jgi:hypothetical protein